MAAKRTLERTTDFGSIWDEHNPVAMHERFGNLWVSWTFWAITLEDAEIALGLHATHRKVSGRKVVMPMLLAVRAMLLAYALECHFKALWLRSGNKLVIGGKYVGVKGANDHDLVQLARVTKFAPTTAELAVLKRLSKFLRFAGRYPVAKTADDMRPDELTQADVGFFSKRDFRIAESLLNKVASAVSGKKRRVFPRRLTRQMLLAELS
ncbi:MAG TPA: hypothetical protein VHC97_20510 [Thermoanaerobaculia bacterium]|jgi:hypothetical protein|nr:hypothetical protein [Thermoanaerobaculia bacterium]